MNDKRITYKLNRDYWSAKLTDAPYYSLGENHIKANKGKLETHGVVFTSELNTQLLEISKSNDLSIYKLLVASLAVLIYKYASGQNSIYIATPSFKSDDSTNVEDVLVYLGLRLDVNNTARELLKQVHEEANDIFQHQAFDFDDLLGHLKSKNGEEVYNLLQLGLCYPKVNDTSKYLDELNLVLELERDEDEFKLITKYNTAQFAKEYIARLSNHFINTLSSIVADVNISLDQIELLTDEEREQLLFTFNDTKTDYPRDKTIAQLFEEQVSNTPDEIALVYGETSLTYSELNQKANQLAHYLRESCDIKADDLVVALLDKSDQYIVTILGILKAGAGYVPIDTSLPQERMRFMLDDLEANAVVTTYDFIFELEGYDGKLIGLDIQQDIFDTTHGNSEVSSSPDDAAYVIYTSGTTGQPKGVVVTQRNVARLVKNTNFVQLDQSSRLLMTGAISFDASTYEIWGMLLNGGQLHLLGKSDLMNTETLKSYVVEQEITHMWFTSSWFNQLVNTSLELFENLQYLIVGGEKLSSPHINSVLEAYPGVNIRNGYGPTENTTFSTYHSIEEQQGAVSIIGKPLANSEVLILDDSQKPVPVGVQGEIYLGGDGLSRGYLKRPELTAEKFIDHPYKSGHRLYKSGDQGKWQADGTIAFIGRKDNQIKLRGFRIELEEVTSAINAFDEVKQALVIYNPVNDGCLVAYVISDTLLEDLDLKIKLQKVLPEYMIPTHFVAINDIPLTANGKLDQAALPDPVKAANDVQHVVAPSGEVEEKLAEIWMSIFHVHQISVHDNFFDLGGHSITAIKMLHRIHSMISTEAQINDIFTYPTIRQLGEAIENMTLKVVQQIPTVPTSDYYETSYSQKRFWLVEQTSEGYIGYNVPSVYLFEYLDTEAFEKAMQAMIERHEILRTTFTVVDEVLMQKVHTPEAYNFKITHQDLSHDEDAEQIAKEIVYNDVKQPIDLEKGPLLKAKLFKLDNRRFLFYALTHHIISDSESLPVVLNELLTLYAAFCNREPNPLKPLRIQYKDFAAWQNSLINSEEKGSLKDYWHQQIGREAAPELSLPLDFSRVSGQAPKGDSVRESLEEELLESLEQFSNSHQVSNFVTLLTAYYLMLHRYTGKQDIIVGTPVAGRAHADLEGQVGCYINMLPLKLDLTSENTIAEVLDKVNTMTVGALEHQEYPFELLIEELQIKPLKSGAPMFDTSFSLQVSDTNQEETGANLDAKVVDSQYRVVHVDLLLQAWKFGESTLLCFDYNASLFKRETVELMKDRYVNILRQMANNENLKVIDISFDDDSGKINENELEIDLSF